MGLTVDKFVIKEEAPANESSFSKCICEWSNDGKKMIPDKDCPIHGPRTRKMLEQPVSIGEKVGKQKPMMDKIKFWAIAGTIAIFTAVIIWRVILKFV